VDVSRTGRRPISAITDARPTLHLRPFIGTIIAAGVAGVYGEKAVRMKQAIDSLTKLVNDDQVKLDASKKLIANMRLVSSDLQTTLDLIGPAIKCIEKMMGIWNSIAGDLGSAKDAVEDLEKLKVFTALFTNLKKTKVIQKWNDLKTAVDQYRKVAFISTPDTQSIIDYANALTVAIQKSS